MFDIIKKKRGENDCCLYCTYFKNQDGRGICRYKGEVLKSGYCKKYKFNPFAPRIKRVREVDTTMFDPLDFKI